MAMRIIPEEDDSSDEDEEADDDDPDDEDDEDYLPSGEALRAAEIEEEEDAEEKEEEAVRDKGHQSISKRLKEQVRSNPDKISFSCVLMANHAVSFILPFSCFFFLTSSVTSSSCSSLYVCFLVSFGTVWFALGI